MKAQWQKYLAELFGTFILVFVGSASLVGIFKFTHGQGDIVVALLIAPFAFGLALLAGSVRVRRDVGRALQPAVSLAMFLDRRLSVVDLVGYWLFQFVGAILASPSWC